jgi:hypothetical protein
MSAVFQGQNRTAKRKIALLAEWMNNLKAIEEYRNICTAEGSCQRFLWQGYLDGSIHAEDLPSEQLGFILRYLMSA